MDYLLEAIRLATENVKNGGRPFASVIVKDNRIVATGLNLSAQKKDPTAHAEIEAIRKASEVLKSESLNGCELYTTSEPCPMCLGALYWAELDKVVFSLSGNEVAKYYYGVRRYHKPENFYAQYLLPYNQRALPMKLEKKEEAVGLFNLWKNMNS